MKVTSGKERSNNHVQVNHCVVDWLLCPLFCATQNQEPHWEMHFSKRFLVSMYGLQPNSATSFWSACTPGKYPIPPENQNGKRSQMSHLG